MSKSEIWLFLLDSLNFLQVEVYNARLFNKFSEIEPLQT